MSERRELLPRARRWLARNALLAVTVFVVGSLLGVGIFTFGYARGYSYLLDDPNTCINCHIMEEQYDGWLNGVHSGVAGCNDCHAPHDNFFNKWYTKGENGFRHALLFTTGGYPENIQIRERNERITDGTCLYCHGDLVDEMHVTRPEGEQISCITCHSDVGHM